MGSVSTVTRFSALAFLTVLGLFASTASAMPPFTQGNIVVVRMGDGAGPLNSAATAVFLDEYTPAGALVQTIALPTGAGDALTNSGSATSEGFLTVSSDGLYLIQAGYRAVPLTLSVATTTSVAVPRVIALIDMSGNIDTTTALTDAYSGSNIRSAASDNGTQFWTGGTSAASGSVRYVGALGATTSTQLSTTITNTRVVSIFGGQLYVSSATGAFQGVSAVGAGLPTTSGQTIALLPGFPTTTGPSAYDQFWADASTLFVADDRSNGSGGIQKWTLSGGTWTLQYTLAPSATVGCRGLSGIVRGGVTTLFATTGSAPPNQIVTVTDAGAGSPFTTVAIAPANTAFRGLRYIPVQAFANTIAGTGCPGPGPIASVTGGLPIIGNFATTLSVSGATASASAILFVQFNVPTGSAPPVYFAGPCGYVLDLFAPFFDFTLFTDLSGGAGLPVGLPADPALLNIEARFQWAIVDGGPLGGLTISDAVLLRIGEV